MPTMLVSVFCVHLPILLCVTYWQMVEQTEVASPTASEADDNCGNMKFKLCIVRVL